MLSAVGQNSDTTPKATKYHAYFRTAPAGETDYTGDGLPLRSIDPLGVTSEVDYDALSRPVLYRTSSGDALGVEYEHGLPSRITNSNGSITRIVRDSLGQVVLTVFPDGTEERRAYDRQGHLTKIRDGAGRVGRIEYDLEGRVVRVEDAGGIQRSLGLSAEGDVIEERTVGRHRLYEYANYHQIASCHEAGESVAIERDAEGRRLSRRE